jgi:hypothetical protein
VNIPEDLAAAVAALAPDPADPPDLAAAVAEEATYRGWLPPLEAPYLRPALPAARPCACSAQPPPQAQ